MNVELPRAPLAPDGLPLYVAVATRLREDLLSSGARSGDRLPSERVLTERYGASRVTVRSALAELQRLGAVEPAPSRGWFVSAALGPTIAPHVEGLADWARSRGLRATARVLRQALRPSTVAEAEQLRLAPGTPVVELRRLRSLDGLVVVLERNRIPAALCPALLETDFTTASLYATLAAADPPVVARVADYSVEARHPREEEAHLLEIDDLVPVLVAEQLSYDEEGRPMELTQQVYRGDRYQFRASITSP